MLRLLNSHPKRGEIPDIEQNLEEPLIMMDKLELSVRIQSYLTGRWRHDQLSPKILPYLHGKPRLDVKPYGEMQIRYAKETKGRKANTVMTNGSLIERAENRDSNTTASLPVFLKNQLTLGEKARIIESSFNNTDWWGHQLDFFLAALSEKTIEPLALPFGWSGADIQCDTIQLYFELPIPADENKFFPVRPEDVTDASVVKMLTELYPKIRHLKMTPESRGAENPLRHWV